MLRNKGLNGFGTPAMRISVILGVEFTNRCSEYPVLPKAPSRNASRTPAAVHVERLSMAGIRNPAQMQTCAPRLSDGRH
jgi:hypothetical protein